MRIVKNKTTIKNSSKVKIAYSICGEGHGHYGRNVAIINALLKKNPGCEITLYLYGDTWNIFSMDKEIIKKVKIKKIPGFRFIYKKTGVINSFGSTIKDFDNILVSFRILKLDFFHSSIFPIRKFLKKIFKKTDESVNRYYSKYFDDFDFAITDLEPLLPRVADIRRKPFLTLDNQHAMLYGYLDKRDFNLRERIELFFIKNTLKIYHPVSDLSILTCFYNIPILPKYKKYVAGVGPIIRDDIIKIKSKANYGDYILVYAHKILESKLFPVLAKLDKQKFVVFATFDSEEEIESSYKKNWIEYHSIDPIKFIDYLAGCKAVISTVGNTLISESMFLKKPFYGISLEGNFEQRLNLYMLEKSKLGKGCKISKFDENDLIEFINNIDCFINEFKNIQINDDTNNLVDLIVKKINKDVIFVN